MDGPPSLMAALKGDSYAKHGNSATAKWVWTKGEMDYPDGKWLACNYGSQNEVILSKKLTTIRRRAA